MSHFRNIKDPSLKIPARDRSGHRLKSNAHCELWYTSLLSGSIVPNEIGERDISRELADAISRLTERERHMVLKMLQALRGVTKIWTAE